MCSDRWVYSAAINCGTRSNSTNRMALLLILIIVRTWPEAACTDLFLVTPRNASMISKHDPDALCCSLRCPSCSDQPNLRFDLINQAQDSPLCKCDSLCTVYGDCCPGYLDRCSGSFLEASPSRDDGGGDSRGSFECVRTSSRETGMFWAWYGFFMVASCSDPEWREVGELCRNSTPAFGQISDEEFSGLIQTLPVSSDATGLHYKNIYCALCNGLTIDSLIPWDARCDKRQISQLMCTRYWFEPPSTPSLVNITKPRSCTVGVTISDPELQNSPLGYACSGIPSDVAIELQHSSQRCLECVENPRRCFFPLSSIRIGTDFTIPFNFVSLAEKTFQYYIRLVSWRGPGQQQHISTSNSTEIFTLSPESACETWRHELNTILMFLRISSKTSAPLQKAISRDVVLAFERRLALSPQVDFVSRQKLSTPFSSDHEPLGVDGGRTQVGILLKVDFGNQTSILGDWMLSSVANHLLDRQNDFVVAVGFILPCGNYTIDECISGILEADAAVLGVNDNLTTSSILPESEKLARVISYEWRNQMNTGPSMISHVLLCHEQENGGPSEVQKLLYQIGTGVSLVGLSLTFITYLILSKLRTVPGLGTMNLVVATFLAQLGLLVAGEQANVSPGMCTATAVLLHYLWLASFFWTSCLALGLSRTLGSPLDMKHRPDFRKRKWTAILNAVYGWGIPLLIVAVCLLVHFAGNHDRLLLVYGTDDVCWIRPQKANLVAFGVPVLLSLFANVGMFGKAVKGIRASKKATQCLQTRTSFMQCVRSEMSIYVKVSLLMGFSWLWAFLGAFTHITVFWYLYVVLNSFQGAYIMVAFVCNPRVLRMLSMRLRGRSDQSRTAYRATRLSRVPPVSSVSNKKSTVGS